jgi:putative spermidine/putrescine transport system permease protein
VLGGIVGLLVAYAAIREGTPRWVRSMLTTFSGVAANFGGIPLAFAFIATLGPLGLVTLFFRNHVHYDLYQHQIDPLSNEDFSLFSKLGVELAYMYFQLPLMILVIAPAIDGLRKEWREAAANLGAKQWQFWRYVGIPVLMPSLLGAIILLFGNAFAAYATAYSLTSGSVNIVPVLIGAYYTGNVLDNPHLAQALAFGMFAVLALMMVLYIPLQRRAARWAK